MSGARHGIITMLLLLAVPAWLYLWLGSGTSPQRILVFVAGYLLLGVVGTTGRATERPARR